MKLEEYLQGVPDERTVYIGAKSAFILGGTKDSLSEKITALDEKLLAQASIKREEALRQYRKAKKDLGEKHDITKAMHEAYLAVKDPLPILERNVLHAYERQTEDALNIIITGEEAGKIWSLNEEVSCEIEYNAEELVGGIFREAIAEYKSYLKTELKTFKKLLDKLEEYRTKSEDLEKWLRSPDVKCYTTLDAEYLIMMARQTLAETLAESKKKP